VGAVLADTTAKREGALPGLAALRVRGRGQELHRPVAVPGECQLATVHGGPLSRCQLVQTGEGLADAESVAR
jgi:hypothetical protein